MIVLLVLLSIISLASSSNFVLTFMVNGQIAALDIGRNDIVEEDGKYYIKAGKILELLCKQGQKADDYQLLNQGSFVSNDQTFLLAEWELVYSVVENGHDFAIEMKERPAPPTPLVASQSAHGPSKTSDVSQAGHAPAKTSDVSSIVSQSGHAPSKKSDAPQSPQAPKKPTSNVSQSAPSMMIAAFVVIAFLMN